MTDFLSNVICFGSSVSDGMYVMVYTLANIIQMIAFTQIMDMGTSGMTLWYHLKMIITMQWYGSSCFAYILHNFDQL